MKNIITTIALFVMSVFAAQAQIVVKYNTYYRFSHDLNISTYEAFKNNLETNLGSFYCDATWSFDTTNMVFTCIVGNLKDSDKVKDSGKILKIDKINNEFGGIDYVFLIKNTCPVLVSVAVFQNTKTERMLMTKNRGWIYPDKYFGTQAVIVD